MTILLLFEDSGMLFRKSGNRQIVIAGEGVSFLAGGDPGENAAQSDKKSRASRASG